MINLKKMSMAAACGVLLLSSSLVKAQSVTYTFSYEGPQLPIPRNSADLIALAGIFVPKSITVTKVTVNIDIDYPSPGDINLYFYSPQGTRTKLLERNCGNTGALSNITFDDSAPSRYSAVCPTQQGGTYQGNEPLSNSNGQNAFGTWTLTTENNGSDNLIGWFRSYSITVTGTPLSIKPVFTAEGVRNAASLFNGAIAPGESLYIYGAGLGPVPGVEAPSGNLPTSLGGVSVTFDNTPAAISIASLSGLAVQAPYSLQPGATTVIRVTSQGVTSDPVNVSVVGAAPGIFTQSSAGLGVGKILNQDGTANSAQNPAAKGSYVAIYANGLGAIAPPLTTGQVPPSTPLSLTAATPSVVIGGVIAPVIFSGAAPPYPGIYQVNVQIPAGAATGANFIDLFQIGQPSQSGVIIYIQ